MPMPGGRPRKRPLLAPSSVELTPGGSHRLCRLEHAPTPGGSQRSPVPYKLDVTPALERGSARKRRLDRNRQAELHAACKLSRGAKRAKPTALDFERLVVESVDMEQPELSFDMAALEDRILVAQHSTRQDQKDAAAVLRSACERDEKVSAAVHLMMGRELGCKWTCTGKERAVCGVCKRSYATNLDGTVRKHNCVA